MRDSTGLPTLLITGATGFIGSQLASCAASRGYVVHGAARNIPASSSVANRITWHQVDLLSQPERWREAMAGVDVVIHAAARAHVIRETESDPQRAFETLNTNATRRIAEAAVASGVRRLVFISSIGVNGNTSGPSPFTEDSKEAPVVPYTVSKLEAERTLRLIASNGCLEVVIVRPPLVYGPGVKANFLRLLKLSASGLPLPLAAVRNRRSLVSIDNLVDFLLACAVHERAANETFLVSDGTVMSTAELIRAIAGAMQRPARLVSVPTFILKAAAVASGRRHLYEQLCESLEIDITKAARRLGWSPSISAQESLEATVRWYCNQKDSDKSF